MTRRSVMFKAVRGSAWWTVFADYGLVTLIVLNVFAVIMETVPSVELEYGRALRLFDIFSVIVFSIEYVARIALCTSHPSGAFTSPVLGRIRYVLSPMAIVDLLAILPFYLGGLTSIDLRFLRALRLLRVLKLTRYSTAMEVLLRVLRDEAQHFGAAFFILLVILICAASGMYLVEHDAQPEAFGSIPAAMWWAVATLTTVGYGDVTPITAAGKFFGALITVVGVGMVALPAGILASAFSDNLRRRRGAYRRQLEKALADGLLTAREKKKLQAMRAQLGIDDEDASEMLKDATVDPWTCPKCGHVEDGGRSG